MTKSSETRVHKRLQKRAVLKAAARQTAPVDLNRDLRLLQAQCHAMMAQPGRFLPMLKNAALVAAAGQDEVLTQAKIMSADMSQFKSKLDALAASIPDRHLEADNPDDLMFSLAKGDEFADWMDNFQKVVLPTADRLSVLLQNGMANLNEAPKPEVNVGHVPTQE